MATLGKPQRQHRIARLLEEQVISSQAQIVELLGAEGVLATQATVSRDLEELGAVKVRIPGGTMAYAVPEHSKDKAPPDDHLRRVMGEFVVEVAHSANLACCARRRARRTSSPRRSTAPGSPTCSAPSPVTTRSSSCARKGRRRARSRRASPSSPVCRRPAVVGRRTGWRRKQWWSR